MVDRPDLDEFLGALSGFLNNQTNLPEDPTYFRFLEIFCRSVGSVEGHLLHYTADKGLQSIISCGVPKKFDEQINRAFAVPARAMCPLDVAFRDQQVLAVTDLYAAGAGIPSWFLDLVGPHKLKSLIAVPLIGQTKPVGVLCAYYRDVCLFDQGTLDRLMTIGRMVGSAMENALDKGPVQAAESTFLPVDAFLESLTANTATKAHVFQSLIQVLTKAFSPSGIVCGPLHMGQSGLMLTISDGTGVPPNILSHHYLVPAFLAQKILLGKDHGRQEKIGPESWEAFRPFVSGRALSTLCQPIVWKKKPEAAIIAWRTDKNPFTEMDEILAGRLAAISSLALRSL